MKESRLNIRLNEYELQELKDMAKKDGITLSDFVRKMINREKLIRAQEGK